MQAQFDVEAASFEDACDLAVEQAMQMESCEWGTTELLGGPRRASCLKVVELAADVLDDLLGRAEALAEKNIRTDIFEDGGRRETATGCVECMRYNRGEIEHAPSCVTGRLLGMTGQLRTLQARHALTPAAPTQPVRNPYQFLAAAERRVVCGDEVTDELGRTYCCDVEPEHDSWHIDKGRGKAWPSLAAWPVKAAIVDAREIGVLG